jgi:hypothetical protein
VNAKARALLWEELCVNVPMAGVLLAVGLLLQVGMYYSAYTPNGALWHQVADGTLAITLGVPLLLSLLLPLNVANSGHLLGGFSRRILRLPVDTSSAVALALLTRLATVLVSGGILAGTCWLMFRHGPGSRAVFLVGAVYLLIQVLDWFSAVMTLLIPLVAIPVVLLGTIGAITWGRILASESAATPAFLLILLACFGLAYGISLVLVKRARCGERLTLESLRFDTDQIYPSLPRRARFNSPLAACIWFEFRRAGFSFPLYVFGGWLFLLILAGFTSFAMKGDSSTSEFGSMMNTTWTLEVFPLIALLMGSFAWSMRMGNTAAGKGRPDAFNLRLPLPKTQIAKARLIVMGGSLGLCLTIITAISAASFLLADHGLMARLMWNSLGRQETSLREVFLILLGPSLVAGLGAWFLMTLMPTQRYWTVTGVVVALAIPVIFVITALPYSGGLTGEWISPCLSFATFMLLVLPSAEFSGSLLIALDRGLLATRTVNMCLSVWVALSAALVPFFSVRQDFDPVILVMVSLTLGTFAVAPYPSIILALSYRGRGEPVAAENVEQHRRIAGKSRSIRVAGWTLAVILLGALAWLRWPVEPAWKTTWRAKGLPATAAELNAWYRPVAPKDNLAYRYLAAAETYRQNQRHWAERYYTDAEKEEEICDQLASAGNAKVPRAEPLPENVWLWTKRYYDEVAREICADLHAASRSGLTASRYPVDYRDLFWTVTDDFSYARSLQRLLYIEALVAGVERRSDAATEAILDMLSLANSFRERPDVMSQLVRIALTGMAVGGLEDAMNRVSFSEAEWNRLKDALADVFPPPEEERFMDRAFVGEECLYMNGFIFNQFFGASSDSPEDWLFADLILGQVCRPVLEMTGLDVLHRLVTSEFFARLRESGEKTARENQLTEPDERGFWTPRLRYRALTAYIGLSSMEMVGQSEWRIRTHLNLAQTAIAVERYRRAREQLPRRLEELVPLYMREIPPDYWSAGNTLAYAIRENGEYVVSSRYKIVGSVQQSESTGNAKKKVPKDLTFTVAPPEIRNRPQVVGQ